jgi:hypothetical protein
MEERFVMTSPIPSSTTEGHPIFEITELLYLLSVGA